MLNIKHLSFICDVGVSVCNTSIITVILIPGVHEPGNSTLQRIDPMLIPAGLSVLSIDVGTQKNPNESFDSLEP